MTTKPATAERTEQADQWAIVELMGHVRLAGRLTEEEKFGAKMGRLDIPLNEGFITQYFGGGSVYRITFVSEDVARHVAKQEAPAPVSPWDFPKVLGPGREREPDLYGPRDGDDDA
jgi:hypothetical protein